MLHGENLCFLTQNVQSNQKITIWNPVCTIQIPKFQKAMKTLIQERHNHTESSIAVKKASRNAKKMNFTSQMKDWLLHFLVRTCITFLETILSRTGVSWKRKDLTSQCLLTKVSAYILLWYTQTWSSTILLATQNLLCCAAFPLFPS